MQIVAGFAILLAMLVVVKIDFPKSMRVWQIKYSGDKSFRENCDSSSFCYSQMEIIIINNITTIAISKP
jgi:hypothetical protein